MKKGDISAYVYVRSSGLLLKRYDLAYDERYVWD